jgi:hypothetical protein
MSEEDVQAAVADINSELLTFFEARGLEDVDDVAISYQAELVYESTGFEEAVTFLGFSLWCSEYDERDTDEETGNRVPEIREHLESQLRKVANIVGLLGTFNVEPDKAKQEMA